jgi:hypothetical protein
MTPRALLPLLQRILVVVVLAWSGGYMLVYLYRWEWNRAIVSGIFFVAAEVALATSMILRRLHALERTAPAVTAHRESALQHLRANPVDHPNPFAWLDPHRRGSMHVFVPVLLGAGVVLSALAYVVERVASATATPVLDRRLSRRLDLLAPAEGGLLGGPDQRGVVQPAPHHRARSATAAAVALSIIGLLLWMGIDTLADLTQTRPERAAAGERTTIELDISQNDPASPPAAAGRALWVTCRSTVQGSRDGTVVATAGDRVVLTIRPGIGRLATRRLTGCLSDMQLDRISATVLSVETSGQAP